MDTIEDVTVVECEQSKYIKPQRIHYTQAGKKKAWDAFKVHDSVAILIYNSSRDVFVFVKQFRPAVYINCVEWSVQEDGTRSIDTDKYPGQLGVTYELCAGIIDKPEKTPVEIAREEILEECGFQVGCQDIIRITGFRNGVGTAGSYMNLFYAEVTDEMKVSAGGGNPEEGEMIEVVEWPVAEGHSFILDESKNKPVAMMFALQWFYNNTPYKRVKKC